MFCGMKHAFSCLRVELCEVLLKENAKIKLQLAIRVNRKSTSSAEKFGKIDLVQFISDQKNISWIFKNNLFIIELISFISNVEEFKSQDLEKKYVANIMCNDYYQTTVMWLCSSVSSNKIARGSVLI